MLDDTQAPRRVLPVAEDGDHILGLHSAPVTLMEFGDFECPHCGQAHVVLQELLAEFRDSVRLVFRHFPLTQIHPHAQTAAEAAEAAGAQKAFWKMHDTLFENQNALEFEDLLGYADQLGLDLQRFQLEVLNRNYAGRVRHDFSSGVHSGVNGTPTFFINGRRHDGAWDLESLSNAISAAMVPPPAARHPFAIEP